MRLLGYHRVSTDEQATNGHSLGLAPQLFHQYCALHGHTLVDVVADEGVSASIELDRRPGGRDLLNRLDDGEAEGVLIRDLDRMFRLTIDGLMTFALFDRRGLSVLSVNDSIDTTTPEGKMALTIRLATCEYERNKTAQRTKATMAGLKADGRVYGHVPYGLVEVGGRLFKNPDSWAVRELIMELREAGMSLRAVCAELFKDKVPAPRGGRQWNVSTVTGLIDTFHEFDHIPPLPAGNVAPGTLVNIIVSEV